MILNKYKPNFNCKERKKTNCLFLTIGAAEGEA